MNKKIKYFFTSISFLAFLTITSVSASAEQNNNTTDVSVEVTGGSLWVEAIPHHYLGQAKEGEKLENVLLDTQAFDQRAGTVGWVVSAKASDFVGTKGYLISKENFHIKPKQAQVQGIATVHVPSSEQTNGWIQSPSRTPVQSSSYIKGDNSAVWVTGLKIDIPDNTPVDRYRGILTHTIL